MNASRRSRIAALDGIRGIAILLVLLYHLTYFSPLPEALRYLPHLKPLVALLMSGWVGVDLFFVLSGFLITGILLETKHRPGYFRSFILRRILRIFPLYYLVLGLYLLCSSSLGLSPLLPGSASWLLAYLGNVLVARRGWDAIPTALQHCWSLALEEQYYLLWPLLIAWLDERRAATVCVLLTILSGTLRVYLVAHGDALSAYVSTPARLDGLAIGSLLSLLAARDALPSRAALWLITALATAVIAAIVAHTGWFYFEEPFWAPSLGITCATGLFMVLVTTAVQRSSSLLGRVLACSTLRFFGRYSYGIYLWHQPILSLMVRHSIPARIFPRHLDFWLSISLFYLTAFVLVTLVAVASFHLVERWFLQWKDRLAPIVSETP